MTRLWILYGALAATHIRDVTAGVASATEKYDLRERQVAAIPQPDTIPEPSPVAGPRIDINSLEAISQAELDTLAFYAQFAAASYCNFNNEHPEGGNPVECDGRAAELSPVKSRRQIQKPEQTDVCPLVEKEQTKTFFEFKDQGIFDSTGFIAVDDTRKEIVLSYRGTHSAKAFIGDLYAFPVTDVPSICLTCTVHSGFWTTFQLTEDSVKAKLQEAHDLHKDYKIIVTGHSLGGALATLAAVRFRQTLNLAMDLYTYGSPRVGDWPFAYQVSGTSPKGSSARVSHIHDPVPGLPLKGPLYSHYWPNYFITSNNTKTPETTDIKKSGFWGNLPLPSAQEGAVKDPPSAFLNLLPPLGFDEAPPNAAAITLPSIAAHLFYFRSVTGCDPKMESEFNTIPGSTQDEPY